jgi:type VI secretion system protein VasD
MIVLMAVCGLLVSCGSSKMNMGLMLEGTNQLNQSDMGQPVPVTVRIYTLKDRIRFEQATFQELWKKDYEFLGKDLLDRKEITLSPSTSKLIELTVDPEDNEKFIGIMVLFRKYQDGTWRRVIPIEEPGLFSFGDPEFIFNVDRQDIAEPVED